VARFLCGYTGHALALAYFGMPSSEEAERGMGLHVKRPHLSGKLSQRRLMMMQRRW